MCAIFGIGFMNGHRVHNLSKMRLVLDILFKRSQVRGRMASGLVFATPRKLDVLKHGVSAEKLIDTKVYHEKCEEYLSENSRLLSIIGHTRQPTKGTYLDNKNNHPIIANRVVGVHNGIISNDDDIFDNFSKFAGKEWTRSGQVDSEIIFRLVDYYSTICRLEMNDSIMRACRQLKGGYACALVSGLDQYSIWIFRNTGPIEMVYFPKVGVIIFASSMVFIKQALEGINLGTAEVIEVPSDSGMGIDLYNKDLVEFKLLTADTSERRVPRHHHQHSSPPGLLPPNHGEA
jgi:glucosamine 6-phosphate synthetase-like amidotransferase/phosphosugar isomerase protein